VKDTENPLFVSQLPYVCSLQRPTDSPGDPRELAVWKAARHRATISSRHDRAAGEPNHSPLISPARRLPAWDEASDQTPVFDPVTPAPEPAFAVRPDHHLVKPRLGPLCELSVLFNARGGLPRQSACSVRLLPPLTQARRALSASAPYVSAPLIILALDPWPASGHPVVREERFNYLFQEPYQRNHTEPFLFQLFWSGLKNANLEPHV